MKKLFLQMLAVACLLPMWIQGQDMAETSPVTDLEIDQLESLIYSNLRYPDVARQAGVSGAVRVKFSVSPNGKILNLVAVYPGEDGLLDPSVKQYTVVANATTQQDKRLKDQAERALQAESLMVLNRIQKLAPIRVDGQGVLSSREVVFHYKLL
ncbi:MAG: energy transducer TonB [Bacteroidota bacterium]